MINDTPTLLQVFGPPCYSKLILSLNFFAFYRCLSYTREFIGFAFSLYKITLLLMLFAQVKGITVAGKSFILVAI